MVRAGGVLGLAGFAAVALLPSACSQSVRPVAAVVSPVAVHVPAVVKVSPAPARTSVPVATRAPSRTVVTPGFALHYRPGSEQRPLVVVLGASGRDLAAIRAEQGQDALADDQDFSVAYVPAPNPERVWSVGPDVPAAAPFDGVTYLIQQLHVMATYTAIDLRRIYIEGWSNGGFMAAHALTTAPGVFAAAGEIESVLDRPVTVTRPVRLIHLHAPNDVVVPIAGGDSPLFHGFLGRPVDLPSSLTEGERLPHGSEWKLVRIPGVGPAGHGYEPSAAATFWEFFAAGPVS